MRVMVIIKANKESEAGVTERRASKGFSDGRGITRPKKGTRMKEFRERRGLKCSRFFLMFGVDSSQNAQIPKKIHRKPES
jgi:hypothetical protein